MSVEYVAERLNVAAEQVRDGLVKDALSSVGAALAILLESGEISDTLAVVFDDVPERIEQLAEAIDNH